MVFFTCNACGQSVKKNQVEKHYQQQCRNCHALSCMDCGKEFWGDEYKKHTKCVSEDQKYGGKDFKPKPSANKGEAKQEMWIEHVKQAIATAKVPRPVAQLLEQLMDFSNIPRKKIKFENFVKNSVRIRNPKLISEAWEVFSKAQQMKEENSETNDTKVNTEINLKTEKNKKQLKDSGVSEQGNQNEAQENGRLTKKKKRKHNEELEQECKKQKISDFQEQMQNECIQANELSNLEPEETGKFKWNKIIKAVLLQSSENELSVKKLRKKVLAEYRAQIGENIPFTKEQLLAKFGKKILKNPKFKVHKERVKLIQ